jgi:hypothetical protein
VGGGNSAAQRLGPCFSTTIPTGSPAGQFGFLSLLAILTFLWKVYDRGGRADLSAASRAIRDARQRQAAPSRHTTPLPCGGQFDVQDRPARVRGEHRWADELGRGTKTSAERVNRAGSSLENWTVCLACVPRPIGLDNWEEKSTCTSA